MIYRSPALLIATLLSTLLASACASAPRVSSSSAAPTAALPFRIFESATGRVVELDQLIAAMERADVVFFGEHHDDSATHVAQLRILSALAERRPNFVLSLEMFERDVQPALDSYLAGSSSEADFLANSRPWPRYATDYRPLVEFARSRNRPVIAANVPRPVASEVSRRGLSMLDSLPTVQRSHVARESICPLDAYYERFGREMPSHGSTDPADAAAARAIIERYYQAQCVKDETMAESIVLALRRAGAGAGAGAVVLHVNGAFHSDYRQGTVQRVIRRDPTVRILVLTAIPEGAGMEHRAKGDFVLIRRSPRP